MNNKIYSLFNNISFFLRLLCLILIKILFIFLIYLKKKSLLKVGVVGVRHETNIGNNLLKYAISIKLTELGYIPYIIGTVWNRYNNIIFLNKKTNLVIIKNNFSEIKSKDYDILIVNSDQTWAKFDKHFYDYGFLKFAENWTIPKFIYGASIGKDFWTFTKKDEEIAKKLLKNFTSISVREIDSIELIKNHLGIIPELVLDPTFLIHKKYYLNLIKGFKGNIIKNKKYIFVYNIANNSFVYNSMKNASKILNLEIYYFPLNNGSLVENFLYYLINSKAVLTNSYHGTIFSIIFNKPFITTYSKGKKSRFNSLGKLFNISERFLRIGHQPKYDLLTKPLNIDNKILKAFRQKSINFIKQNLKN